MESVGLLISVREERFPEPRGLAAVTPGITPEREF